MKIGSFLGHMQIWSEFMMIPVLLIGSVFNIHIVRTHVMLQGYSHSNWRLQNYQHNNLWGRLSVGATPSEPSSMWKGSWQKATKDLDIVTMDHVYL